MKHRQTDKFSKTLIVIRLYLLQFRPSVLPFVFVASFIPSFNVLCGYFDDSSHCLNLITFVTQLLYIVRDHVALRNLFSLAVENTPIAFRARDTVEVSHL